MRRALLALLPLFALLGISLSFFLLNKQNIYQQSVLSVSHAAAYTVRIPSIPALPIRPITRITPIIHPSSTPIPLTLPTSTSTPTAQVIRAITPTPQPSPTSTLTPMINLTPSPTKIPTSLSSVQTFISYSGLSADIPCIHSRASRGS